MSLTRTAIRLALFNHKGGVGKTTLTMNVAEMLAATGSRVLLVDSDPQCNLTSYLVEEAVVNDLLDKSDSSDGRTLWSALKPIVEASGDFREVQPLEVRDRLFLLPGDIRLAEFEQELVALWSDCFQRKLKGFRGTAALSALVNTVAAANEIDFIFYDAGPNIGPLNRVILLDVDGFIIPAACDLFSVRALKTLGHSIVSWVRDWKTISELAPSGIYMLPGSPKLLGYVPQRFKIYAGVPTADQAAVLPLIERQVHSDVISPLSDVDKALVPFSASEMRLGEIKDFGSLATISQRSGVPMHAADGGSTPQREAAFEAFSVLANAIKKKVDDPRFRS